MAEVLRVGLFLSKEKMRKIKLPGGIDGVRCPPSIQLIEIDPDQSLESQGPFDVIIQKVLEWDKKEEGSNPERYAEKLLMYCNQNPSTTLVDPVSSAQLLIDRPTTLKLAEECKFQLRGRKVFVPPFVTFDGMPGSQIKEKIRGAGIYFPVVCKSTCAAGHGCEHAMSVVFCEDHLNDINYSCIIQQFINHGGMMHKIYVVGEKYYICERPSIRDLKYCKLPSLHFNGNQVSKEGYCLPIHRPDLKAMKFRTSTNGEFLDKEVITELLRRLRKKLRSFLFGIDLIVDQKTGDYGIVDVNYFPGYGGVLKQFQKDLFDMLKDIGIRKGLNIV